MKQWNELTCREKLDCVSLYPDEARKDEDWQIRLEAYRALGFTEEALKDFAWQVRLQAYRAFGFTKDALQDDYWVIREDAEIYFRVKEGK